MTDQCWCKSWWTFEGFSEPPNSAHAVPIYCGEAMPLIGRYEKCRWWSSGVVNWLFLGRSAPQWWQKPGNGGSFRLKKTPLGNGFSPWAGFQAPEFSVIHACSHSTKNWASTWKTSGASMDQIRFCEIRMVARIVDWNLFCAYSAKKIPMLFLFLPTTFSRLAACSAQNPWGRLCVPWRYLVR